MLSWLAILFSEHSEGWEKRGLLGGFDGDRQCGISAVALRLAD